MEEQNTVPGPQESMGDHRTAETTAKDKEQQSLQKLSQLWHFIQKVMLSAW